MRLGLFTDATFRAERAGDESELWCGEELLGFMHFACAVGARFDRFVVMARATEDENLTPFRLPGSIELAALPSYSSLRQVGSVLAALPKTIVALWQALARVDLVWVSASHPIGLILILLARLRGKRTAILVRQDSMAYFRARLPSRRWTPILVPLRLIDGVYRLLGRRMPTTVVGEEIAAQYRAPRENVATFTVNLISESEISDQPEASEWGETVHLLTVGRIEPEKNPLLLVEALSDLNRAEPGRYHATWAGSGRLAGEMRDRARQLGVAGQLHLAGFVPIGEPLLRLYDEADVLVHVALTEGVPQVLSEAMARGLPIVATDVGGVRRELGDGSRGLLVPPRDGSAIAAAVERLGSDPALRRSLVEAGLRRGRETSLEAQSQMITSFLTRA